MKKYFSFQIQTRLSTANHKKQTQLNVRGKKHTAEMKKVHKHTQIHQYNIKQKIIQFPLICSFYNSSFVENIRSKKNGKRQEKGGFNKWKKKNQNSLIQFQLVEAYDIKRREERKGKNIAHRSFRLFPSFHFYCCLCFVFLLQGAL